jgi:hypothetical protein
MHPEVIDLEAAPNLDCLVLASVPCVDDDLVVRDASNNRVVTADTHLVRRFVCIHNLNLFGGLPDQRSPDELLLELGLALFGCRISGIQKILEREDAWSRCGSLTVVGDSPCLLRCGGVRVVVDGRVRRFFDRVFFDQHCGLLGHGKVSSSTLSYACVEIEWTLESFGP